MLVLAMRDREWLAETGLSTLRLGGLAAADAAALADAADGALDGAVRQRVVSDTDGNPLAILEAVSMLSGDQRRGTARIARPLEVGPLLASGLRPTTRRFAARHTPRAARRGGQLLARQPRSWPRWPAWG